jgi:hypothetical protein
MSLHTGPVRRGDGRAPAIALIDPTRHCTNLAAAVYTVLHDRHAKRVVAGLEPANTVQGA